MLIFRIVYSLSGKLRSCYKQSFSTFSSNGSHKSLYVRTSHRMILIPLFCLDINQVETKFVFHNDSINAFITSNRSGRCSIGISSISHFSHQVQNHFFKCCWRKLHNFVQQIICKTLIDFSKGTFKGVIRCFTVFAYLLNRVFILSSRSFCEFSKRIIAHQPSIINYTRRIPNCFFPFFCNAKYTFG